MAGIKEARREIAPGFDLVVRGEDIEAAHAVLAEVLFEMTAEAGGEMRFNMRDLSTVEEMARRLRAKGVDPETGQWIS